MLNFFEDHENFSKIYFENTNSPILIWNESMRNYLESKISLYLKTNDFETLMEKVEYEELKGKIKLTNHFLKI